MVAKVCFKFFVSNRRYPHIMSGVSQMPPLSGCHKFKNARIWCATSVDPTRTLGCEHLLVVLQNAASAPILNLRVYSDLQILIFIPTGVSSGVIN